MKRTRRIQQKTAWSRAAGLAALVGLLAGGAMAQPAEYRLGDDGWEEVRPADADPDAAFMAESRALIVGGRPSKAKRLLDKWIKANEFTDNPWLAEAYLTRGDALTARGDEYEALFDYETVARQFPESDAFFTALERELEIAKRYAGGMKRKSFGLRYEDASREAEELFVRVAERTPGSRLAEEAMIELADHYYRRRDLRSASDAYEIFLENFPRSEHASHALSRRIFASIARYKGPAYDASSLLDARLLIDEFAARFPADAERLGIDAGLKLRLDESAALQMLETVRWYVRRDDEPSAIFKARRLLRRYPASVAAVRVLELAEQRGWDIARPAGDEGDGER